MVEKLKQLETHLRRLGISQTYRGDPYGKGLDWVYFDCFFNEAAVRQFFDFGPEISYLEWDGRVSGQESGFYQNSSGFGIMGNHPMYGRERGNREITGSE